MGRDKRRFRSGGACLLRSSPSFAIIYPQRLARKDTSGRLATYLSFHALPPSPRCPLLSPPSLLSSPLVPAVAISLPASTPFFVPAPACASLQPAAAMSSPTSPQQSPLDSSAATSSSSSPQAVHFAPPPTHGRADSHILLGNRARIYEASYAIRCSRGIAVNCTRPARRMELGCRRGAAPLLRGVVSSSMDFRRRK